MEYEDFLVQVGIDGNSFTVRVKSPGGEAAGWFEPPFASAELDGLLASLRLEARPARDLDLQPGCPGIREQTASRRLGQGLFGALFREEVKALFDRSLGMAEAGQNGLRIRLELDLGQPKLARLHRLPWELLCPSADQEHLSLSRRTSVVRHLDVPRSVDLPPLPSVLRILVTASGPTGTTPLELERECQEIRNAWKRHREVVVSSLENVTLEALQEASHEGPVHVLHFAGHGSFDPASGQCDLLFESEGGDGQPVNGPDLSILTESFPDLRLVMLNACSTARAFTDEGRNPFAGVATALARVGVPAVVAMQAPISDRAALAFSNAFYRSLAAGAPIDSALGQGRRAIHAACPGSAEWATPVLFLRAGDGRLFEFSSVLRPAAGEALIRRYLGWLIEQFGELDLPGLPLAGRRPAVPLESVYVALRGDLSNPHERAQSRALLEQQALQLDNLPELEKLPALQRLKHVRRLMSLVARHPLALSIEERDRPQLFRPKDERTVTLGEAFQRERRLVILGDPGSGKTTLARWLTLQLARSCLDGRDRVLVPSNQVDPASAAVEEVDLGPARIPIFLRVSEFARARKEDAGLSLASFLGHHLGTGYGRPVFGGRGEPLNPGPLHEILMQALEEDRAVVLLDGLDEISDPADRYDIVREIERFMGVWLPAEEMGDHAWESGFPRVERIAPPCENGGNQVVVTSRIVGYQMAPLKQEATHLTIEPMGALAVARFCDIWVRAIHRVSLPPNRWNEEAEREAALEAEGLKAAIEDLQRRGAGDLASNPLLVTILALVFRHGHASFPRQRVKLYQTAVRILLEKWRQRARLKGERELSDEQALAILVPLAAEIHDRSSIGLIDEDELTEFLSRYLTGAEAASFQTVLRAEVGLLTARGEGVYGFLHLTFQEYLAACALVREQQRISRSLLEKLSSPRWREPVLMALGQLSEDLEEDALAELLLTVLDRQEDPLGHLAPRGALLLVAALPEMAKVPAPVVEKVATQLLDAYADRDALERVPPFRDRIERAFIRLADGEHAPAIDRVLIRGLTVLPEVSPGRLLAAAALAYKARRRTPELAEALTAALPWDTEAWEWPVDRALRDLASHDFRLLPLGPRSLRRSLQRRPELLERVTLSPAWRRLLVAVYGGYDSGLPERLAETREALVRTKVERERWKGRTEDPLHQETTERLDAEVAALEEALKTQKAEGNRFSVDRLYRDSPLTSLVLAALEAAKPPSSLMPDLWQQWRGGAAPRTCTDALLALTALGVDVSPELQEDPETAEAMVAQLSCLKEALRMAVRAAVPSALEALKEAAAQCPPDHWSDLLAAILEVGIAVAQEGFQTLAVQKSAPVEARPAVCAEAWSLLLSGTTDDPRYDVAVVLDTLGAELSTPPELLAATLAASGRCVTNRLDRHPGWGLENLYPYPRTGQEMLAADLDALTAIPDSFAFLRGWALSRLAPLLRKAGLLTESLILAFATLSAENDGRADALQALTGGEASLLALLVDPNLALTLLDQVEKVTDAFLRFRACRSLLRYYPQLRGVLMADPSSEEMTVGSLWQQLAGFLFSYERALSAIAPAAAQTIRDPAQQAWAYGQLAALATEEQRSHWLELARRTALRIPDREQRSRALARLAVYLPVVEGADLLDRALRDAAAIANPRRRAETFRELRTELAGFPDQLDRLEQATEHLRDPWLKSRSQGLAAPLLQRYEPVLAAAGADTCTLLLAAGVRDLRRRFGLPADLAGLWGALAGERRGSAVKELQRRAQAEGLHLTKEAAVALDRRREEGDRQTLYDLLSLLRQPAATLVPLLEDWLADPDPALHPHVILLLAEAEGPSARTIPELLTLLADPEDLVRYRAALVLHSDFSSTDLSLTTAVLGEEVLTQLARHALEYRERDPQSALVISWMFEGTCHNDGNVLRGLAKTVAEDLPGAREAEYILKLIFRIDANAWTLFLAELSSGTPRTQRALLLSLCNLAVRKRLSEEQWQQVLPILTTFDEETLSGQRFLLQGPAMLVQAAAAALEETGGREAQVARAERELAARSISLAEVVRQEPATLRETLRAIGNISCVNQFFREGILAAARQVEKTPAVYEILIDWLAHALKEDTQDWEQGSFLRGDLLPTVAAAAEYLPNTFLNKAANLPAFDLRLRQAVQSHNTFTGRQAALVLLSYLRRATPHALAALRAGLRDVVLVQETAVRSLDRYRDIDPQFLSELLRGLRDPSPTFAFASAWISAAIARNVYLPPQSRQQIQTALVEAIQAPESRRDVYLLLKGGNPEVSRIEHKGRLDQVFAQVLVELSGLADLDAKHPRDAKAR